MIGRPKLVLASGSPRRLGLLNQAGLDPDSLEPVEIDESPERGELPRTLAVRLAREKAEASIVRVRKDPKEFSNTKVLVAPESQEQDQKPVQRIANRIQSRIRDHFQKE
jgi:predicted house-cleaning NTP pyrophosphatase (Maf/HAM1 superfamily)